MQGQKSYLTPVFNTEHIICELHYYDLYLLSISSVSAVNGEQVADICYLEPKKTSVCFQVRYLFKYNFISSYEVAAALSRSVLERLLFHVSCSARLPPKISLLSLAQRNVVTLTEIFHTTVHLNSNVIYKTALHYVQNHWAIWNQGQSQYYCRLIANQIFKLKIKEFKNDGLV